MTGSILLRPERQEDLQGQRPDYHIYAGQQRVGRIYKTVMAGNTDAWFWGVNSVTVDMSIGAPMNGHADSLEDAKAKLRGAFDRWLAWAEAMPKEDLKHPRVAAELGRMCPTPSLSDGG